ncbi:MAG: DUF962 domain-containing protein [Bacteroidia bacterium]|nr:DUF962 domain-containing protein [Bacteroidia bacterium]
MKSIDQWFEEYGESHQNKTNKSIHFICVPLIYFSIIGLLSSVPSLSLLKLLPDSLSAYAHFGALLLPFVMLFYLRLSVAITIGMMIFSVVCLVIIQLISFTVIKVWMFSLIVFALAWSGQFYGHKVEGKKPSFLKDLQFLLIGPAWILGFVYRKFRISY